MIELTAFHLFASLLEVHLQWPSRITSGSQNNLTRSHRPLGRALIVPLPTVGTYPNIIRHWQFRGILDLGPASQVGGDGFRAGFGKAENRVAHVCPHQALRGSRPFVGSPRATRKPDHRRGSAIAKGAGEQAVNRQRLTGAELTVEVVGAKAEAAWEHGGSLYLRIVANFLIENVGRIAAYKWALDVKSIELPTDRMENYFFNVPVEGAPGRSSVLRIDATILPGVSATEEKVLIIRLGTAARGRAEVEAELAHMLPPIGFNACLATETSPGSPITLKFGPEIDLAEALKKLGPFING